MNDQDPNCNAIEHNNAHETPARLALKASALPPMLAELLQHAEILSGLGTRDLREMSKFDEVRNVEGLAVHPVHRPDPGRLGMDDADARSIVETPALPDGVSRSVSRAMCVQPFVVTEGTLAGAGSAPFAVRTLIPMPHAHLASAMGQMLWPWPGDAGDFPVQYTLLQFPGVVIGRDGEVLIERFIGHWPGRGLGVAIGFDDPALAARLLLDAAGRGWAQEGGASRLFEGGKRRVTVQEVGKARVDCAEELKEVTAAAQVAMAEPLFVELDEAGAVGAVSPVWRNPLMPVSALGLDAGWSVAAREVGALPFGDVVDDKGRLPLEKVAMEPGSRQGRLRDLDRGLVVVPRGAIPAPWMSEARRYSVAG